MIPAPSAAFAGRIPFSAISVDARTGKVLFAVDPDGLRHPASLTKMMTLYVLFQDLKAGKLKLDSPIRISARAASMAPSRLGVKPGTTITVDTAIRAVVVKSANDVASAIAENLGGSETAFATRMTQTARGIGMSRTTFRNASGLPNPGQWTTARDMATMGLRLQRDFPEYYPYFRTLAFSYGGGAVATHNRLLGKYQGADGIKTGYTAASGFNLVSSAERDGKRLVGTVLGGASGTARNRYMMRMLDKAFPASVAGKTIAALAGSSKGAIEPAAADQVKPDDQADLATAAAAAAAQDTGEDGSGAGDQADSGATGAAPPEITDTTSAANSTTTGAADQKLRKLLKKHGKGSKPTVIEAKIEPPTQPEKLPFAVKAEAKQTIVDAALAATPDAQANDGKAEPPADTQVAASLAQDSWYIRIGSFTTKEEAISRLRRLMADGPEALRDKATFTEIVQKGTVTSYRARFSGFSEKNARQACQEIQRKNMSCYVVAPNS
ncbi:MAG: D-alanyl-D-alanine carboxypeptidase [Rhizobiales bacterium]|nr:D-alanyl-D-alanine carboxypeptidase [Hyphomicrobiales bacterium]